MATQTPLTTHLQKATPTLLTRTTTAPPFLHAAGTGKLPKPALSYYLSQDRLYAHTYIRFVGQLLSKTRIPTHNPNTNTSRVHTGTGAKTTEERVADVLIDALVNVRREVGMFGDIAAGFGVDLNAVCASSVPVGFHHSAGSGCGSGSGSGGSYKMDKPASAGAKEEDVVHGEGENAADKGQRFFGLDLGPRKAYADLMISAGGPGVTLLEGLVVLWAMEVCYLRAWGFVRGLAEEEKESKGKKGQEEDYSNDADGGALRRWLIPNWTSAEFEQFVKRIGDVVDELAGLVKGAEEGENLRGKCLEWWRQVLWLEESFWPEVRLDKDGNVIN